MDLKKIQEKQLKFIESMKWARFNATQVFAHLIEELGEVASHLLYSEAYKIKGAGHQGTVSSLSQEFAQSFNLFLQLASMSNIDLEDAWIEEYEKNKKRFDKTIWEKLAEDSKTAD